MLKKKYEIRKKGIAIGSERGFVKLILAVIGLIVVLSLLGVKFGVIQDIGLQIWYQIILPVVERIAALLHRA